MRSFLLKKLCLFAILLSFLAFPQVAGATEGERGKPLSLAVNKIVAVVNGEIVTMHDLRQHAAGELSRSRLNPKDPAAHAQIEVLMRRVLDVMIENILLRQEAERLKIKTTDQEVDNEIRKLIQRNQMTQQQFEASLAAQGARMDLLKERIRNNILSQRIIGIMIARKIIVTPEEINAYYDEHKREFVAEKSVDFSLIVFAPKTNTVGIVKRIRSGSLSFAAAATQYTVGPAKERGGHFGKARWEEIALPLREHMQNLAAGDLSDVFQLDGRDTLVKINEITHGRSMTLEEATPVIEQQLREPKLQGRFHEYMEQLRSRAVVDIRM